MRRTWRSNAPETKSCATEWAAAKAGGAAHSPDHAGAALGNGKVPGTSLDLGTRRSLSTDHLGAGSDLNGRPPRLGVPPIRRTTRVRLLETARSPVQAWISGREGRSARIIWGRVPI